MTEREWDEAVEDALAVALDTLRSAAKFGTNRPGAIAAASKIVDLWIARRDARRMG